MFGVRRIMAAVCAMFDPIMPAAPMMTSLSCVTKLIVSYTC